MVKNQYIDLYVVYIYIYISVFTVHVRYRLTRFPVPLIVEVTEIDNIQPRPQQCFKWAIT